MIDSAAIQTAHAASLAELVTVHGITQTLAEHAAAGMVEIHSNTAAGVEYSRPMGPTVK